MSFGVWSFTVTVCVVVLIYVGDAEDMLCRRSSLAQRLTENLEFAAVALEVNAEDTTALSVKELAERVKLALVAKKRMFAKPGKDAVTSCGHLVKLARKGW